MSANTEVPAHFWWIFSKELNIYCYFDSQRHQYVTQDGRIAASPRYAQQIIAEHGNQPKYYPQDSTQRSDSYNNVASTNLRPPIPRFENPSDPGGNALDSQLATLSLGSSNPGSDQSILAGPSGPLVRRGTNNKTGVTTIEQVGPTDSITDVAFKSIGIGANKFFRGSGGDEEEFDPGFKKRDRKFFVFGKVFLSLWTEPLGGNTSTVITSEISKVRFGQRVFSKVRRFIVIREGDQSCTALPIFTYNDRGLANTTHKVSEHGLVYAGRDAPGYLRGEENMQSVCIRLDPDTRGDKLDPISRIHYGKVYTIEHNLKVKPFGMVNRDYQSHLIAQFKAVWVNNVGLRNPQPKPLGGEPVGVSARVAPDRLAAISESSQRPGPNPRRQAPGLTERQREAVQEHGRAAVQRWPRRHGSVRSGSVRSTGGRSNEGDDADVNPLASPALLSAADQQRVRDVYIRYRQELVHRGVDGEDATLRAQNAAAEKMRQLLAEMASNSRPSGGPRSSSGNLVVGSPPRQGFPPPTPAMPIPSSQTRSSSIGVGQQMGAKSSPSSLPSRLDQTQYSGSFVTGSSPPTIQPQQLLQRTTSANPRPVQQSSSRTPTMSKATVAQSSSSGYNTASAAPLPAHSQPSTNASTTVDSLVRYGYSVDSANRILALVDKGLSLATSKTVSNLVSQGYTMAEAIASVTQQAQAGSKK